MAPIYHLQIQIVRAVMSCDLVWKPAGDASLIFIGFVNAAVSST
jgi:hypothetical protein